MIDRQDAVVGIADEDRLAAVFKHAGIQLAALFDLVYLAHILGTDHPQVARAMMGLRQAQTQGQTAAIAMQRRHLLIVQQGRRSLMLRRGKRAQGRDQLADGTPDDLGNAIAEHARSRSIEGVDASVITTGDHAVMHVIEDGARLRLLPLQGLGALLDLLRQTALGLGYRRLRRHQAFAHVIEGSGELPDLILLRDLHLAVPVARRHGAHRPGQLTQRAHDGTPQRHRQGDRQSGRHEQQQQRKTLQADHRRIGFRLIDLDHQPPACLGQVVPRGQHRHLAQVQALTLPGQPRQSLHQGLRLMQHELRIMITELRASPGLVAQRGEDARWLTGTLGQHDHTALPQALTLLQHLGDGGKRQPHHQHSEHPIIAPYRHADPGLLRLLGEIPGKIADPALLRKQALLYVMSQRGMTFGPAENVAADIGGRTAGIHHIALAVEQQQMRKIRLLQQRTQIMRIGLMHRPQARRQRPPLALDGSGLTQGLQCRRQAGQGGRLIQLMLKNDLYLVELVVGNAGEIGADAGAQFVGKALRERELQQQQRHQYRQQYGGQQARLYAEPLHAQPPS